jgi:hypothetical protein
MGEFKAAAGIPRSSGEYDAVSVVCVLFVELPHAPKNKSIKSKKQNFVCLTN